MDITSLTISLNSNLSKSKNLKWNIYLLFIFRHLIQLHKLLFFLVIINGGNQRTSSNSKENSGWFKNTEFFVFFSGNVDDKGNDSSSNKDLHGEIV